MSSHNGHVNGAVSSSQFDIEAIPEIKIPTRVLMGAGPSASYPEALRAMGANTLGHLDPEFIGIMNNVGAMLRRVFRTKNPITGAISGTGTAGMEAALCNLIEPGDEVLVCVSGYFSNRMQQMCERMGAVVHVLESPWGVPFLPEQIDAALSKINSPRVLAIVHAETSSGTLNPIDEVAAIAHKYGALVVVDAVTSLAGCPLLIDEWDIDVCFSGTQKCIGSPPGLSPITFSPRAMDRIRSRRVPVQSWYLDMSLVETYWGDSGSGGRAYHHTAPSNALFGLHEALRLTLIEGLENRWARHELHSRALMAGLLELGLKPFAQEGYRLWQLNAVWIPEGIDDVAVRSRLLRDFNIEIGGGLGEYKGRIWRIGVMGYSAQRGNIRLLLSALEDILEDMGHVVQKGSATDAAQEIYEAHDRELDINTHASALAAPDPDTRAAGMGETVGAETAAQGVAHRD
jgi:alanine-glyoxylate transaminase/serine-glyoxylate transaminase/serine-pyruvate transaminase